MPGIRGCSGKTRRKGKERFCAQPVIVWNDGNGYCYYHDPDNPKQFGVGNAKRRALNLFDQWNNITGFVVEHTSYYYELQSLIEDAVECGAQAASGVHVPLECEEAAEPVVAPDLARCVCNKCGQPHNPRLIDGGEGQVPPCG